MQRPALNGDSTDPAKTELWLIRHAESTSNRDGRFQGQLDVPLSDRGKQQAQFLALRLQGHRFAALYSSDLQRAADTAWTVAKSLDLVVALDKRLREVDVGAWSGLTAEEVAARFPDEWQAWQRWRDPLHRRGAGESYTDLLARVTVSITEIARAHPGQKVAIVSHGGAINSYLACILGIPLDGLWRISLANTSITRVLPLANLPANASRPGRLVGLNDCGHLEMATSWAER